MFYQIYSGSVLPNDTAPSLQQLNFPIPPQSLILDYRHDATIAGGVVLSYWGVVLTDPVSGLNQPQVGFTTINSIAQPESRLITINLGVPVIAIKFSAYSNSGRKLFLAVVSEQDFN